MLIQVLFFAKNLKSEYSSKNIEDRNQENENRRKMANNRKYLDYLRAKVSAFSRRWQVKM